MAKKKTARTSANPASWVAVLSQWFEKQSRPLPWRATRNPYPIWISEVMLQQTQVATVIPYFHRFLEAFPDIESLARAEEESVLRRWAGLGYYSRARNLQRGAQFLVKNYGGKFPTTREAMLDVPGIGPYTAGAILSIAFDLPVPLVDGNVQRVFARFFGVRDSLHLGTTQKLFWKSAEELVGVAKSPRIFNQALMELGALVCIKGTPRCVACPISSHCIAFKKGWQSELPVKKPQKEKVDLWWAGLILESQGKLLLHKNGSGDWWSGLWDLPRIEVTKQSQIAEKVSEYVSRLKPVRPVRELGTQRHTVTHHRIHVLPYWIELKKNKNLAALQGRWFAREELLDLPVSSLVKKVLSELPPALC